MYTRLGPTGQFAILLARKIDNDSVLRRTLKIASMKIEWRKKNRVALWRNVQVSQIIIVRL